LAVAARLGTQDVRASRPKRDYDAQTARGNRLFELGLGPVALALCGASTAEDHKLLDRCLAHSDKSGFAARFLEARVSSGPASCSDFALPAT
jgi:type IV secretion system protein VirB4